MKKPRFIFTEELIIRASNEHEVLKPLHDSLPWDKRFKGAVMSPACRLKFTTGGGGRRPSIDLFLEVSPNTSGYKLKVSATWFDWLQIVVVPVVTIALASLLKPEAGLILGSLVLLFMPLWILNGRRGAREAIKALILAYNASSSGIKAP